MKKHTISEWIKFFGIEVIDWDGFTYQRANGQFFDPISLVDFIEGMNECTICPADKERYAIFNFID